MKIRIAKKILKHKDTTSYHAEQILKATNAVRRYESKEKKA